ncbi:M56 family metallopeptidase [Massilia sp. TN1-12]|uniref:M56 family metallopeptidase n=1 Tax=Massilia paldalensis TaxID=3377675 RepID=UPI0038516F51
MSAQAVVAALGWVLLNFLWQGCVIACITAELLVALRNARPESRYAVACLGLALCLAWPAAVLVSVLAGPHDAQAGAVFFGIGFQAVPASEPGNWLAWLQAHTGWIVALWTACVAALCLRTATGLLWIGRTVRKERGDPAWQARLSAMAERCGLGRDVRLRVVERLASPVTAGWWRPVVLVPASLVAGMPPHLLEALLAHELGHIKRHDYLVNLLQNVVEILLFYHPAVWWISRRIRTEREQIADDFAARHLGDPRRLALALSELERLQFAGTGLAQAANGGDLLARIRRLLRPSTQSLDWRALVPVLGLALAFAGSAQALAGRDAVLADQRSMTTKALADFSSCARPDYPQADIDAGHQGTVTLAFLVDQTGIVGDSRVERSSGFASMDEAAHGALRKCRFHPALQQGRPVTEWTRVQYVWTLE